MQGTKDTPVPLCETLYCLGTVLICRFLAYNDAMGLLLLTLVLLNSAPTWYADLKRPEWWLVVAAFVTLGVIAWQAIETRRAAQATKEAAEAALLNAQAVVNAERAWLTVTARAYGHERFYFEATNHGKTPAEIVNVAFDWKIGAVSELVDVPPQYKLRSMDHPEMLLPGDPPFRCAACNVGDLLALRPDEKDVREGAKMFMMYGKVLYYDTLQRKDPPHESKYCFFWDCTETQKVEGGGSGPYIGHT